MATHRITLTTIGTGISSTLDLQRWNGTAWVTHITNIPRASFLAENGGYEFEDITGSVQYKLVDDGVCGTEKIFYCVDIPTTTAEATTTGAGTTTDAPTTTSDVTTTPEPTTTSEPIYTTWWATGNTGSCGDPCGQQKYTAIALAGNPLTVSYLYNTVELIPNDYYAPGIGTIGFTNESFGNALFTADLAIDGAMSNNAICGD